MWGTRQRNQVPVAVAAEVPQEETPIAITESDLIQLNDDGMTQLHEAVNTKMPDLENIEHLITMADGLQKKKRIFKYED